jgi:alkylation response protein AidB-like acyl-CoA dehydrogenase
VKKGDEYIINGQKTWNTGAHRADWGFGVFKTDPEARKHHNMTFILFDMKTPGITVRPIPYLDGSAPYCEVYFDDVRVPGQNIVGQEHEGWAVVNLLAGFERSGINEIMSMIRGTGATGGILQRDRSDTGNRWRRTRLSATGWLSWPANWRQPGPWHTASPTCRTGNEMSLMDASAGKIFFSELGERFAFLAGDVLGPYGQIRTSRWAPLNGIWEKMFHEHFITTISNGHKRDTAEHHSLVRPGPAQDEISPSFDKEESWILDTLKSKRY